MSNRRRIRPHSSRSDGGQDVRSFSRVRRELDSVWNEVMDLEEGLAWLVLHCPETLSEITRRSNEYRDFVNTVAPAECADWPVPPQVIRAVDDSCIVAKVLRDVYNEWLFRCDLADFAESRRSVIRMRLLSGLSVLGWDDRTAGVVREFIESPSTFDIGTVLDAVTNGTRPTLADQFLKELISYRGSDSDDRAA